MIRRLIALVVLLASTAAAAEAVVGVMRDRAVHHEHTTVAQAASSQTAPAPSPDRQREDRHDHDTGSDHCTHVHGVALIPALKLFMPGLERTIDFTEPPSRRAVLSEVIPEPPRA